MICAGSPETVEGSIPALMAGLEACNVRAVPINAGSVALAYWWPKLGFIEGGLTN